MRTDADGKPVVGTRRNMLGVRPTDPANINPQRLFDVGAATATDTVAPGEGLSTSLLPRVPQTGEALFAIETDDLPGELAPHPDRPPHCLLEPARPMTLDEYQRALADTRDQWQRVQ